jgi:ABC-type spermidine/putrescine transport system permease subunit I
VKRLAFQALMSPYSGFGAKKREIELSEWSKLQMADFILECILLSFKACLGVTIITGIVLLLAIPINYFWDATKDRLEDWDFRREFDVWRLRNK